MPENNISPHEKQNRHRPGTITIISILFFIFSLFYLLKLSQVIVQWEILSALPLSVSPVYLAVDGLVWGSCGLFVSWILWTGKSWARIPTLAITLLYTIFFWINLIWIADAVVVQTRWLFNLCLSIIGILGVYLSLYSKISQDYFQRNPATID